ncbi:MAG: hypothetical protein UZ15_CFX003001627 [Chloroflexi bacterium OLB15]|nr:MAG: hypothetical protein UZ15_CFX003001627 [Chloroflexi bacterium OLB15]
MSLPRTNFPPFPPNFWFEWFAHSYLSHVDYECSATIKIVDINLESERPPRMTKFIQDSYNGVYVVLLKPYMPSLKTILLLITGVIVGLFWAYVLAPAVFYDSDPSTLQQSWQDEWVKLLSDRNAAANFDVSSNITSLLAAIDAPLEVVDRLLVTPGEEANVPRLQAIRPMAEQANSDAATAPQPNILSNILPFLIAPIIVVILAVVISLLWGMLIKSNVYEPAMKQIRGERVSPETKAMREQVQAAKQAEASMKTDFATSELGRPMMQRMSTFLLGHGNYDDSFSIEDAQERFLGECGASIAETVGSGDPSKPTAIEVWLFDKDDFVRTITTVFASQYAANDPSLSTRLASRGEVVLAQPNATVSLETATLRLQARVVDIQYGTDPTLPAQSFFQKVTVELAAWRKEGAAVTAPAAAPAAAATAPAASTAYVPPPQPAASSYTPPPAAPVSQAPAASSVPPLVPPPARVVPPAQASPSLGDLAAYRPPAPPVASPPAISSPPSGPPPLDDDPFGGSADF